ncbi:methylated-DNA--[protein]-cysteine S-methyltransferase [Candidatus Protochlamydia sp. R18]|uniref:methylated-DNA--[protein]-cysteine S-methyltransferase n=1 Tax=Candidatus Protochlamydia sp. R18 TaxID=1353977 RepID=UPI0005A7D6AF|nr:methylated-DNA--[protein]-cysteine S-methyltransferase [Candidatus Protochlamydia sp. R18]
MHNKHVEQIFFSIGNSSFGQVIVAQSQVGLCAVILGENPAELQLLLQARFPQAHLIHDDYKTKNILSQIIELMENPLKKIDFTLDERGTLFQRSVWKALREIPIGTTSSYAEIAKKINSPKAVRAVGGACAANPLALVTPCHRVIRKDGNLSGYRWGIERKLQYLQLESKLKK